MKKSTLIAIVCLGTCSYLMSMDTKEKQTVIEEFAFFSGSELEQIKTQMGMFPELARRVEALEGTKKELEETEVKLERTGQSLTNVLREKRAYWEQIKHQYGEISRIKTEQDAAETERDEAQKENEELQGNQKTWSSTAVNVAAGAGVGIGLYYLWTRSDSEKREETDNTVKASA